MSLKTLHRIYFGFDGKPDPYTEYLKTWKEQLPDYKIAHWNADNLPININGYTKALFAEKDHAFLSDYFRWWLLKEYGGIYLDADIEIVDGIKFNRIVEELENSSDYHSFIGLEIPNFATYTAHSMACKKNSNLAQFMCKVYENMGYLRYFRRYPTLIATKLVHLYFIDHSIALNTQNYHLNGYIPVEKPEVHAGVMIYPKDYFSPLSIGRKILLPEDKFQNIWYAENHTENTCMCHHFSNSYVSNSLSLASPRYSAYLDSKEKDIYKFKHSLNSLCRKLVKKIYKTIGGEIE